MITNQKLLDALEEKNKKLFLKEELPPWVKTTYISYMSTYNTKTWKQWLEDFWA